MHYAAPFVIIENKADSIIFTPTASPRGLLPDSTLWDEPNIIRLIDGAKQDLVLQFLAYSPLARGGERYDVQDNAIRRAASRGVKVKMIVSDWEKGGSSEKSLKELATVPNIEVKFSVIPDLPEKYISFARVEHCKYIVVDGSEFWLGTSNAEKSYFYNCRNLGVVVKNTKLSSILRRVFMKSWDGPYTEIVQQEKKYEKRKHGE
jgi:phosphatidylserine/phosphatidylglycerophosphate/cardiolipin synthase-like enzyme